MKFLLAVTAVLMLFSGSVVSGSRVVKEVHASSAACRAAIKQYARDTETWMKHDRKFVKITRISADRIVMEREDMKEHLQCEGETSKYQLEVK